MTRKVFTPRQYQADALAFTLAVPRSGLWAGMGMGKTTTMLNHVDARVMAGETRPTLVLGPKRVVVNTWPDEAAKWEHLSGIEVATVVGTPEARLAALKRDVAVHAINYDNLPWLVDHFANNRLAWPYGAVIADESTRLKSLRVSWRVSSKGKKYLQGQGGVRSYALARVAHRAPWFTNLTGTPAPNGLKDLWGQTWFLDWGKRLGNSYTAFMERYFEIGYDDQPKPRPFAAKQVARRLHDLCLTLDPRDYFDLKEPIARVIRVELPAKARKLYRQMERDMFVQLSEVGIDAETAAAKTMKCLQIANGALYTDEECTKWEVLHDAKLEALDSVVEEAAGMPVLVAYHFKHDLARLLKAYPQARELDDNPETIREWNSGRIGMLVAHPSSAGHGLNLQDGGNIVVFYGHWWALEDRLQIIERIGPVRQLQAGHDRPVFIYDLAAADTVDEVVLERHAGKADTQELLKKYMRRRLTV